jgi:type I restriction enzyme S subunit
MKLHPVNPVPPVKSPWPTVRLGDVLTERRETPLPDDLACGRIRIVSKISFDTGRIELRSGSETNTGMILARPRDLVISGINAAKGAIALYGPENTEPIAATIHYGAYTPKPDRADLSFLWWFFRSQFFRDLLAEHVPGGIKTELKSKRLLPIPIPLPPMAEQRRVVARIEELAAQIHEARTLRHQAAEEAEAMLTSHRRVTFGETPQGDWIPLSNFVSRIESGKSPATDGRQASSDEWGVLKVGAVSFGIFDEHENKALPVSFDVPSALEVHRGDFIMSRANTVELVGACALVRKTRPKLMLSDKTFRFVFHQPRNVLPEYMEQVLKSPPLRYQIERGASGTSPTMKNISKEKVLALRLPPFALPEQRRIVSELDALQAEVDALKRLQAETAAELDALLPAILDRAFKGEL